MLYQLSTGKTISISIEQFLELTDEDEQYLISLNYGDVILSPFFRSVIHDKKEVVEEIDENDESIDYNTESDEIEVSQPKIISLDDEHTEIQDPQELEE